MAKRLFDVICSLLGLIILAPLLIVIALSIKLSNPGPIFFRHERVGRYFKTFQVIKFRTMTTSGSGPQITSRTDIRITPFGRVLRQTKLDELPQLFNVLVGEMSLVGPRPEVWEFVDMFRSDYEIILQIRPGITDEASISFRDEEQILAEAEDPEKAYTERVLPRKIGVALHYVRSRSFFGDIALIFRTLANL